MSFSLNEIEALATRAARGAGLPWGLAQEAAMAVRWLASFGLAGPDLLADRLDGGGGVALRDVTPDVRGKDWTGPGGWLCPLICGAAISDNVAHLSNRTGLAMINMRHPLLLLPFAANVARRIKAPVSIKWAGAHVASDGDAAFADGEALKIPIADRVDWAVGKALPAPLEPRSRGVMREDCLNRLLQFGERSFAPATRESREFGAGEG